MPVRAPPHFTDHPLETLPLDRKRAHQIVVRCQGRKAEALLQLPSIALRSLDDDTPAGLWLTVGLLATDGLALQLRLKRAAKVRWLLVGIPNAGLFLRRLSDALSTKGCCACADSYLPPARTAPGARPRGWCVVCVSPRRRGSDTVRGGWR